MPEIPIRRKRAGPAGATSGAAEPTVGSARDRDIGGSASRRLRDEPRIGRLAPARSRSGMRSDACRRQGPTISMIVRMRPAGFEPATKGFKGPRVSARLGLSHPPRRAAGHPGDIAVRKSRRLARRPGARRRGLLLGLTPLVSEPSWPPRPGQAWLRIAVPRPPADRPHRSARARTDRSGRASDRSLGFPQFTRFAVEGYPPVPPFS